MNFFNFDLRKIITLAVLAALPVFSISLQKESAEGPWIFQPFYFASSLSQSVYSSFSTEVRGTVDMYLNLIDIKKNNRELQEQLSHLLTQLSDLTELEKENQRLYELFDFKRKTKMDLLAAKVTGRDLFPNSDTLTINRGFDKGVTPGMAIITPKGVVGYVFQVDKFSSQVLLINHRYAVVDALVQSSRARGILHGYNSELCELRYLARNDKVEKDDLIVTSGLDNVFPKGFPIGYVTEVEKDDFDYEQKVYVKPIVSPSNLEEVFVILNVREYEVEPLAEEASANLSASANISAPAETKEEENQD